MKHVDILETSTAVPIPSTLTRREKLMRWAELVRASHRSMLIYHQLEHYQEHNLRQTISRPDHETAFGVALGDPVLLAAGLPHDDVGTSIREHMDFFELTQAQLHEFSCDCGGVISNEQMAQRIEKIANAA